MFHSCQTVKPEFCRIKSLSSLVVLSLKLKRQIINISSSILVLHNFIGRLDKGEEYLGNLPTVAQDIEDCVGPPPPPGPMLFTMRSTAACGDGATTKSKPYLNADDLYIMKASSECK